MNWNPVKLSEILDQTRRRLRGCAHPHDGVRPGKNLNGVPPAGGGIGGAATEGSGPASLDAYSRPWTSRPRRDLISGLAVSEQRKRFVFGAEDLGVSVGAARRNGSGQLKATQKQFLTRSKTASLTLQLCDQLLTSAFGQRRPHIGPGRLGLTHKGSDEAVPPCERCHFERGQTFGGNGGDVLGEAVCRRTKVVEKPGAAAKAGQRIIHKAGRALLNRLAVGWRGLGVFDEPCHLRHALPGCSEVGGDLFGQTPCILFRRAAGVDETTEIDFHDCVPVQSGVRE